MAMRIERLENRALLTVFVSASGVLTVVGTAAADHIAVSRSGTNVLVTGSTPANFKAPIKGLTSINISGQAGNDSLAVSASLTIASTITGGDGNDIVTGGGG